MDLLSHPRANSESIAIVDVIARRSWSYAELSSEVERWSKRLRSGVGASPGLVFCFVHNDVSTLVGYLAALRARHAVVLLDGALGPDLRRVLIERYSPQFIFESIAQTPLQTFGP